MRKRTRKKDAAYQKDLLESGRKRNLKVICTKAKAEFHKQNQLQEEVLQCKTQTLVSKAYQASNVNAALEVKLLGGSET